MTPTPPEPAAFTDAQLAQIKKLIDSAHAQHHQEKLAQGDWLLAAIVVFFSLTILLESRIAPSDGQTFQVMSAAMGGAAAILFANLRRGGNATTTAPSVPSTQATKVTVNA